MKRALITGVTGQDGAYLSQLLLEQGYEVYGLLRRSASADVIDGRLRWLGVAGQIRMFDGDILDLSSVLRILREVKPDEVYNLGAQSFVKTSWTQPILTGQVTALGVGIMLEAVRLEVPGRPVLPSELLRDVRPDPGADAERDDALLSAFPLCRRQALRPLDDGELSRKLRPACEFGDPLQPRIPACGASSSSPARSRTAPRASSSAWPRRSRWAISTQAGTGDMRAITCRAMHLMLQQEVADDYVVATGRTTSIRDMCTHRLPPCRPDLRGPCDDRSGLPASGRGRGTLLGNPAKARAKLGWTAEISLEEMISEMVEADLARHRARIG